MVRGLRCEPPASASERLRALPYFIHNLVPSIRQTWITFSGRRRVTEWISSEQSQVLPDSILPVSFASTNTPLAVVVNRDGILLGAIDSNQPGAIAVEGMNPAPQTIRPDMTRRLASALLREAAYLLITTGGGEYCGRYLAD